MGGVGAEGATLRPTVWVWGRAAGSPRSLQVPAALVDLLGCRVAPGGQHDRLPSISV